VCACLQVAAQAEQISALQAGLKENGQAALQLERAMAELRMQVCMRHSRNAEQGMKHAATELRDASLRAATHSCGCCCPGSVLKRSICTHLVLQTKTGCQALILNANKLPHVGPTNNLLPKREHGVWLQSSMKGETAVPHKHLTNQSQGIPLCRYTHAISRHALYRLWAALGKDV